MAVGNHFLNMKSPRHRKSSFKQGTGDDASAAVPAGNVDNIRTMTDSPKKIKDGRFLVRRYKSFFIGLLLLLVVQALAMYFNLPNPAQKIGLGIFASVKPVSDAIKSARHSSMIKEQGLRLECTDPGRSAISAVKRATSKECRQKILDTSCKNIAGTLYPKALSNLCPVQTDHRVVGNYMGCYEDSFEDRILLGGVTKFKVNNTVENCLRHCTETGYLYAGVQYGSECFCGNERPENDLRYDAPDTASVKCDKKCSGDPSQKCGGYLAMNIFQTGVVPFKPVPGSEESRDEAARTSPVRVVYLLTVSGRAVRQVRRLVKRIYHPDNFVLIHVDSRQDFMFRELLALEKYPNIRLVRDRLATIWGGASLLQMLVHCMAELQKLSDWHWDYVLNLSESDYPVKPMEELVKYLSVNRGRNFVKSHGRESSTFVRKQGLDRTFVECDTHMWRIGTRELPSGIQVDGGSDWICLHKDFVDYVVNGSDELIDGLREYFKYALLPAEAFFHMTLRNSKFCSTSLDNNLHLTNWKRSQGCKCQHKVVDWCGCSPNVLKTSDLAKVEKTYGQDIFFARKFEPIVNQEILDIVDERIEGEAYDGSLTARTSYWQNIYHHEDESPAAKQEYISLAHSLAQTFLSSRAEIKDLELDSIREISSFHQNDALEGILILFQAKESNQEIVEFEVLFKPENREVLLPLDNRTASVAVGTDFDPKEVIFRNIFGAIGPNSEPNLLYKIEAGNPAFNATFVWFDPAGQPASIARREFNVSSFEDLIKPELTHPILPGIWTVLVITGKNPTFQTSLDFLVTPIVQPLKSVDDIALRKLHSGPDAYEDLKGEKDYRKVLEKVRALSIQKMEINSMLNSEKTGRDLLDWSMDLAKEFFRTGEMAVCLNSEGEQYTRTIFGSCIETEWSSRSPDVKSSINGVDALSGKLL